MLTINNSENNRFFNTLNDIPSSYHIAATPTNDYQWHEGKLYQSCGKCTVVTAVPKSMQERVKAICLVALLTFSTLGFIWLSKKFCDWSKASLNKFKNVSENVDVFVKKSIQIDKDFTIKNHLDSNLYNQLWNCKLDIPVFKKMHDENIKNRNIPDLIVKHPFAHVDTTPSMEGLSLIAYYLAQKNDNANLHVCKNLTAFQKKMEEINSDSKDQKIAMVVPTFSSLTCTDQSSHLLQHFISVCIEKENGKLKICVLDSGGFNQAIPSNMKFGSKVFDEIELIVTYALAANLQPNTEFYFSTVKRQYANGCHVFALKDSITFLKDKNFWSNLNIKLQFGNAFLNLSPEFMKSTQSLTELKNYIRYMSPSINNIKLGKSQKTLSELIDKHTLMGPNNHPRNSMIDQRILKYRMLMLFLMGTLSDEKINEMISDRLVQ